MSTLQTSRFQAIGWAALTTFVLLAPGRPDDGFPLWIPEVVRPFADKFVHALLFGVLVTLLHRATAPENRSRSRLVWTLASVSVLVVILEWAQRWVPYRTFDWMDMVAGRVGTGRAAVVTAPNYR